MDGLTFQRFLIATFCVICQSVTRGIALLRTCLIINNNGFNDS